MIKRLFVLARQDLIVAWRSHFVTFCLVILAVFTAIYYALPDQVSLGASLYVYDRTGAMEESGALGEASEKVIFVSSRADLDERLRSARGATGVVIEQLGNPPEITMVTKGSMPEETLNTIRTGLASLAPGEPGGAVPFSEIRLEAERPPLGMSDLLVPIILVFEGMLLGFLFVAVMVFQERQEGSVTAYRTSPSGVWAYVLGKIGVWTILTTLYSALFAFLATRFSMGGGQWLQLMVLMLTGAAFMTALGYAVSLFFKSISDWFFIGVAILVLNMLPQVSFAMPTFNPQWLSWIPSQAALFTSRDIVFGGTQWTAVAQPALLYLALAVALTLISAALTKVRLFKEG
ncbi:MAG: ABC transporter permease [Spirochaetes bacterium]|jgi:ABC-2 type transport system permease protein/fluoroquinolone transport system permease protein|nr:ABC transporter permease [Spirochaetota bacterium]